MSFAWPHLLWLLFVPVALLAWELSRRRYPEGDAHPKMLRAEADAHHLSLVTGPSASRRARPWLGAGLLLGIMALARPQWGRLEEPVFDQSREILIAVDLSRSMLAQDVRPSRLERAKLLIRSLLERLAGERVGLVVFSGTAFLQSPLSADYEILREFLPALGTDYLPEGGTNYGALLNTSLQAFGAGTAADRFLIVLSDGEATDDDWKPGIAELKKKVIRVIGLGVGTAGGAMIPDGAGAFVKDDRGAVVLSKLEHATLQELASATNGAYRDASTWVDLASLLQATVETGRKGEFVEKSQVRLAERFQWALAPALLFLLLSFWREFPVRPRPRELTLTLEAGGGRRAAEGMASSLILFCILASSLLPPTSGLAAEGGADPPVAPLSRVVGRLSAQDTRTAADWSELARTTVTYGQHLQTAQQPVPENPVRDALAAVDAGAGLDPRAADWAQLRQDLEALLKKSDQQKPEQPPPQKQPQTNQPDQQKQDQPQQQDQQKQQSGSPDQEQQNKPPPERSEKPDAQKSKDENQRNPQSAFGSMKEPPPPPPSNETQKVGGAPERKTGEPKDVDPALVLPLQKLEQLRNQDSPAKLFQLMDGSKKPEPAKKGKDW